MGTLKNFASELGTGRDESGKDKVSESKRDGGAEGRTRQLELGSIGKG